MLSSARGQLERRTRQRQRISRWTCCRWIHRGTQNQSLAFAGWTAEDADSGRQTDPAFRFGADPAPPPKRDDSCQQAQNKPPLDVAFLRISEYMPTGTLHALTSHHAGKDFLD